MSGCVYLVGSSDSPVEGNHSQTKPRTRAITINYSKMVVNTIIITIAYAASTCQLPSV